MSKPTLSKLSTAPGNGSIQAVRCWADETLQWEMDSCFELAVRKPTKLISLPLMHLVVGLEERGGFVRYGKLFPQQKWIVHTHLFQATDSHSCTVASFFLELYKVLMVKRTTWNFNLTL